MRYRNFKESNSSPNPFNTFFPAMRPAANPKLKRKQTIKKSEKNIKESTPGYKTIRALVEIANSHLEFALTKKVKIKHAIDEILETNWQISPYKYHIDLQNQKLWISSILTAEITFTIQGNKDIFINKINIPFKQAFDFNFSDHPISPLQEQQKNYLFTDRSKPIDIETHNQQTIYHNEKPKLLLDYTKITSSRHLSHLENHSYIRFNINCKIGYQIYQNQRLKYIP